jgi:hypothetical protein
MKKNPMRFGGLAASWSSLGIVAGPVGVVTGFVAGIFVESLLSLRNKKSDIWFETTERRTYKAPTGHLIYAEPTY